MELMAAPPRRWFEQPLQPPLCSGGFQAPETSAL